jgi:hypothetical protein
MAVDTVERLTLLDPRVDPRPRATTGAPRPLDLRGKRIGLLANGKPNSEEFLAAVGALLRERHGAGETIAVRKPNASRVAPAEIVSRLTAECDVVVTATGD